MWKLIQKLFGMKNSSSGPAPSLPNLPSESTVSSEPAPTIKKSYRETLTSTPNKSSKSIKPEAILLHHSGGSYLGGVNWIKNPKSRVSYHCLIAKDGRRTVFGPDTSRMWHAGVSSWKGRKDLNSWSLGVSFEGDTYVTPLTDDMIASAIEYIVPRLKKWGIKKDLVIDHRMVSGPRKNDLNPKEYKRFLTKLNKALK